MRSQNDWWNYLDSQDELMHYGTKGMRWKKGRKAIKVINGQYIYTADQLRSLYGAGKRRLEDTSGLTARRDLNRAGRSGDLNRFFAARDRYLRTPLGRAERVKSRAQETADDVRYKYAPEAAKRANNAYKTAKKKVEPVANEASKRVKNAYNTARKKAEPMAKEAAKRAESGYNSAKKRADSAKDNASRFVSKKKKKLNILRSRTTKKVAEIRARKRG